MSDLVYFSSVSENTRRFVERLDRPAERIPLRPHRDGMLQADQPYVLIVPTYGSGNVNGAVPKQVVQFLNDRHDPRCSPASSPPATPTPVTRAASQDA